MTLTKTQRIYVGILALAIGAFMVDRMFLSGGPAEAQAATPYQSPVALSVGSASSPAGSAGSAGSAGEALQLLAALAGERADLSELRNAFRPSPAWSADLFPPAPVAPTAPAESAPLAATPAKSAALQRFTQDHSVMSIIRTDEGGYALIDGQLVNVGNKLDGFTLVELTDSAAVFASDAGRVELKLGSAGN